MTKVSMTKVSMTTGMNKSPRHLITGIQSLKNNSPVLTNPG